MWHCGEFGEGVGELLDAVSSKIHRDMFPRWFKPRASTWPFLTADKRLPGKIEQKLGNLLLNGGGQVGSRVQTVKELVLKLSLGALQKLGQNNGTALVEKCRRASGLNLTYLVAGFCQNHLQVSYK